MVCDVDVGLPDASRTHTVEVARGFVREGFDVDLVTRGADPRLDGVRHLRARGNDKPKGMRVLSLNAKSIRVIWKRRRTARRLYVRNRWSVLPILVTGRILGYRVVTQVDDVPFGPGYEREISWLTDYTKRAYTVLMGYLAHGVLAVTPEIKGLLVDQFGLRADRIAVLPNGVDVTFIHPLPREEAIDRLGLDPSLRYVVFCGNLANWVDFDTLLGAFSIVARERSDARLLLVGDGTERARVQRLVQELGLDGTVITTGFVEDRTIVRDYLAASTVTVAAHDNGYIDRIGVSPTKLAEYLAAGRAVVAKEVPGIRAVIEKTGSGIIVSGGAQEMAQALLSLLDPERADALGSNGRRVAEERFAWPGIVHKTVPLFGI
jgi:glycosyltransferase involved in cell wall biosynthesis